MAVDVLEARQPVQQLDVRILGPVEVRLDGQLLDLGGPQPRAVIAHLALDAGRVVPVERLIARLWGERPPGAPLASLQTTLSRLRRLLEPDRAPGVAPTVIASMPPGYVLDVPRQHVDLARFRDVALDGRRAAAASRPAHAIERFDAALSEWRGPALAGCAPDDVVAPIAAALEEERLAVIEDRFEAMLAVGRHVDATVELSAAVSEHPLRERLWSTLAIALYRAQRQADALRAIDQARRTLLDELGLDPGPELRELERRILEQDPSLLAVPVAGEPVAVSEPRSSAPGDRFVGRDAELARLIAALERSAEGRPAVVLVEGEPGIGKSALAERLLDHAAALGWRIAIGRCVDGDLAPALWPIVEVTRRVRPDGDVADAPTEPGGESATTPVEIAASLLAEIDATGDPWCVFVDDLHWADRPTLDVIALLCERLADRRLVVVTAFRPPVPETPLHDTIGGLAKLAAGERITLAPLERHEVAEILTRTTGAPQAEEAVQLVHDRSGGNPFFVRELALLFGETGVDPERAVPGAVRDVVRARLAPLPPLTRTVLQVAAVVGERPDLPVVIAANGLDDESCLDALDPAIVARVLVAGEGEVRFAHALVRDAVLADVGPLQRARLHRAVADAIERVRGDGVDQIETIARHRLAGLPLGDVLRTADHLVQASDVARWRGAFEAADELAEAALDLARQLPRDNAADTVELRALEMIVANEGKRTAAPAGEATAARIDAITRRSGSDAARALSIYVRWWRIDVEPVASFAGLAEQAQALAERTSNPFARLFGCHVAGVQALMEGRIADAAAAMDAAIVAAGATAPDEPPAYVPALHLPAVAALVAQLNGDDEAADVHASQRYAAWFRSRGRVDPTTAIDIGFTEALVAGMRGDAAAAQRAVAGTGFAEHPDWALHTGQGSAVMEGWSAAMLGETAGAERAVAAIARLDAGSAPLILRPTLRTFAGQALYAAGDAAALTVLDHARREASERGEVWWLAETLRLLAAAERRFGDPERADAVLAEAVEVAARQGSALLMARLAAA